MKLFENIVFHEGSKNIEMRYHYLWDMVQKGAICLQYIPTKEQITDVFTKSFTMVKFVYFREKLGMVENASLTDREC